MKELKAELHKLYSDASKHSVYQNIPDFVSAELGYAEAIDESWRSDRPRLDYLLGLRTPKAGERWLDFGANTGFFTLSLARQFPETVFTAVEANPNHARFIERVTQCFEMENVEVIQRAVGLADLTGLPETDFLLHLNVLHHAGHDFDEALVPEKEAFADYAQRYLGLLRKRTHGMLFQMGNNWGGDKTQPLVGTREDLVKLEMFANWLRHAGWKLSSISYPSLDRNLRARYESIPADMHRSLNENTFSRETGQKLLDRYELDSFQGEFFRRPLFMCESA